MMCLWPRWMRLSVCVFWADDSNLTWCMVQAFIGIFARLGCRVIYVVIDFVTIQKLICALFFKMLNINVLYLRLGKILFYFFKEVVNAHQVCIYCFKDTVKRNIVKYYNFKITVLFEYILKCNLFMWWRSWIFISLQCHMILQKSF